MAHFSRLTNLVTFLSELHCSFSIVDPSAADSVMVNCFQKKYIEWLPQVKKGDVIILHKLKVRSSLGRAL